MKQLMENWNKFLKESEEISSSKPLNKIDELIDIPKIGVKIEQTDNFVTFIYVDIDDDGDRFEEPSGFLKIRKRDESKDGRCLDGWIVEEASISEGWGIILYELALEWVGERESFLANDRKGVSTRATSVWDKYNKDRDDVEKTQLDINPDQAKENGIDQLTPDDPSDDCKQDAAIEAAIEVDSAEEWMNTSHAKAYKKSTRQATIKLKNADRLIDETK